MPHVVDDDFASILVDVGEDAVGAPIELAVRLTVPRRVVPVSGRPELGISDTVKLLLYLGNSFAVQSLERRLEAASEGNVVGHGWYATAAVTAVTFGSPCLVSRFASTHDARSLSCTYTDLFGVFKFTVRIRIYVRMNYPCHHKRQVENEKKGMSTVVDMELTAREHEVVTDIWGEHTASDLRKIEAEQLWTMHDQVTDAVQLSYEDDDVDTTGILLPLEGKIAQVLYERL